MNQTRTSEIPSAAATPAPSFLFDFDGRRRTRRSRALKGGSMRNSDSYDRNIEEPTDAEVCAAICYLDPDGEVSRESRKSSSELRVSIIGSLVAFIGLLCLYLWFH